ncbi:Bpnt1 [Symbiodinium sp. CCMP2592]|nr:Bpnt1 [Symbiodinium sp. CCMP2592]
MRPGLLILLLVSSGADLIGSGAADAEDVPLRETTQIGRGGSVAVLDRTPRFLQTNSSTTDDTSNSTSTANDSTLEITSPGGSQNNSSDLQWWGWAIIILAVVLCICSFGKVVGRDPFLPFLFLAVLFRRKSNFDPQTVADRQAQRCVVENLRALYGASLRVVGEEGDLGLEESGDGDAVEIREPSASLIGISQLGQPVAGVISEPYNVDPKGSYGRILWGCCVDPGVAVHLFGDASWERPPRPPGRCLTLVSRSRTAGEVAEALERLREPGTAGPWPPGDAGPLVTGTLETGGAGHKVARVVDGAADLWLFPRPGTSRWDTCAAEAMLEACGGVLRDRSGGRICYDPDTSMGNSEGVLAGADEGIVAAAVRVCATLDVAKDGAGRPLLRPWLEQALKLPEKSLRAFCVEEDCVRGTHASVLRLKLCFSSDGVPVPEALILKRAAPRDALHVALYTRECLFFETCGPMLRDQGVQIPEIFYEETTEGGCVLLMEDLIAKSFHREPVLETEELASVLVGLARLHGCSYESEPLLSAVAALPEVPDTQPSAKQAGELWNKFLSSVPGVRESDSLAVVQDFGTRLAALSEKAQGSSRKCIVHGDFRSENIFLDSKGEALFIDFKHASIGCPTSDVACLLFSSAFLEDLSQGKLLELLGSYWETFSKTSKTSSFTEEQFRREFKLSCLDFARRVPPRSVQMDEVPRQLLVAQFLESLLKELHDSGDVSGSRKSMPGFHAVVD